MARPRKDDSPREYFRQLFDRKPAWLWERSNDLVLAQWQKDHPGEEPSPKVKDAMANVKSILRRAGRGGSGGARPAARPGRSARTAALEELETSIDSVLLLAREQDSEDLDSVVKHLRRARNRVVLELGEPGRD